MDSARPLFSIRTQAQQVGSLNPPGASPKAKQFAFTRISRLLDSCGMPGD